MKCTITFEPEGTAIRVLRGTNLLEAALAAGVHINATCGGQGVCGKCRVVIQEGEVDSQKTEKIDEEEYAAGWRQACRTALLSDCTIRIPAESRGLKRLAAEKLDMDKTERKVFAREAKVLAEGWHFNPIAIKLPLTLPIPTLKDNASDLTRFSTALKQQHDIEDVSVDLQCLKTMPGILRGSDWSVTATLMVDPAQESHAFSGDKARPLRLLRIEGGDTSDQNFAVALDIGTTTISAQLVDLAAGKVIAEHAEYNGQIQYGADVITRIVFAQKSGGAKALQSAVVSSINDVIDELMVQSGSARESVSGIVAAGNTTMTHLLLGMETRYIREAPYVPAASFVPLVSASDVGIEVSECVQLCCFPAVASYVGGDIVSGILGSGVFQREELTLYMDIGTNGEIVLGNREWLACAACSMGPAFEGSGIKHGMRADLGAIEGFHINPITLEPMVITVGRKRPLGICGSGLISVLAELLSACVIDRNGKFLHNLPTDRIRAGRFGHEYVLAWADDSGTGHDIVINEVDIENLIRAKGALFAGCLTLLESLELSFDDVDRVIIAGAFGRYINLEKGKQIGLFPDIPVDRFHFLGNGSLLGSQLVCLSSRMFHDVARIATMMTNVELSDNQSFMDNYMGALFLPHTDARFFPQVTAYLEANAQMIRDERKVP